MTQRPDIPQAGFSLETLRLQRAQTYRRWVLIGVMASLFGYATSSLWFTWTRSWEAALGSGDPFVVAADAIALGLLFLGRPRAAAVVALVAAFVDVHFSLFVLQMPTLSNVGLVVPAFVLASGLLYGGHVAMTAAGLLMVSVPVTLALAANLHPGRGFDQPGAVHFTIVLELVLMATTALVATLLRTFAEVLGEHHASEARSRELQTQLHHAQKLEALGLLAGGVAHDINNLLAVVVGYASLLDRSSDPKARQIGAEIVAAQRRGAAVMKQLLAFARKDVAQPRPIDLALTLAGLTALLSRAVGDRVRLHVEAEPECPILADPGRIEQVLLNLAVNARDAMPDGGKLFIRCGKTDGEVWLEVEDEGAGMDDAVKARIFEPFFTTKPKPHGTGLGLSTVHGIVSDSGGSIDVHSRLGHGTRFVLRWPRTEQPVAAAEGALDAIKVEGGNRSVLLVEDNDGARAYAERVLTEHGFKVTAASSAEHALDLLAERSTAPDLLVCDVILPGLTGPQLAAQLRARWPELRCLFISGYVGETALGAGFDPASDLLLKPFTAPELLARVASKLA